MRLIETDSLTNQNISSALEVGSYTADATREVYAMIFATQVAGNGDYTAYLTIQRGGGVNPTYRVVPITTAAVASGVTSICLTTVAVPVRSGDVVKAFLTGQAGDTTTPDTTVDWFEADYLRPTTADRTLDVSAGGEAGLDWANIGSPTTTQNLSGTTVDLVANAVDAAAVAADAVTEIQGGLATAAVLASIDGRIPAALVSGRMDSDIGSVLDDGGYAPTMMSAFFGSMLEGSVTQNGQTTTFTTDVTGYPDNLFVDRLLFYFSGGNSLAFRRVTAYNGTTGAITLDEALPTTTTNGNKIYIMPQYLAVNATAISDSSAAADSVEANIGNLDATVNSRSTLTDAQVWASGTRTLTSFGTLIADIWSYATRTLTSGGATAADVWAYATRTLTQAAASVIDAVTGERVTVYRGTTWRISLTGLGDLSAYETIYFSVKSKYEDSDSQAILRVKNDDEEGLERVNGQEPGDASNGEVVIDDETAGDITIVVAAAETQNMPLESNIHYDVKGIDADGDTNLISDGQQKFTIRGDATRRVS